MIDYLGATDEMFAVINTANNNGASAIFGYTPVIVWPDLTPDFTQQDKAWMRAGITTVTDAQSALSTCEGAPGQKLYESHGLVWMQLFLPRSVATSSDDGRRLAVVLRNAFRGVKTPGGVWFRNSRIVEVAPENNFFRKNVVSEYVYSEIY